MKTPRRKPPRPKHNATYYQVKPIYEELTYIWHIYIEPKRCFSWRSDRPLDVKLAPNVRSDLDYIEDARRDGRLLLEQHYKAQV